MRLFIIPVMFLSACAYTHQPKLAEAPSDPVKYEQDLKECRGEASQRFQTAHDKHKGHNMACGLFGALGCLATVPDVPADDDYNKNLMQMTDECMRDRGYSVI